MKKLIPILVLSMITTGLFAQGYKKTTKEKTYTKTKLGKDILSFSPMQVILTSANQSQPDLTVGLSYERIFDNEYMGVKLPVHASLQENYFYIMPTLKIYPTRQGVVRFAVGPQLLMGVGKGTYQVSHFDQNGMFQYKQLVVATRKQFGFLLNPSLNVTMAEHFYLDVESSLGIMYYDNMPYANSSYYGSYYSNNPVNPAFQFSFAFGYRF
jgi:hypothetical protein